MKISVRYIILSLLFIIGYLSLVIAPVSAQTYNQKSASQNQYLTPSTNSNVPNNFHNYTQSVMLEVTSGLSCLIAGVDPINPSGKCLGFDTKTGKIGYVENGGGAVGAMGSMIGMLYTPPAHARDYAVNLAQNFGITKSTYAMFPREGGGGGDTNFSGSGFQSLSPLIKIWEAFRNVVYLLFVLVFIVIGVAVMLRVKIDPRTVMTIQNQIPKIIIGLILVTFSYAIAGFLVDLMWVAIYLSYGIFQSIMPSMPGLDVSSLNPVSIQGVSPINAIGGFGGISNISYHSAGSVGGIIASLFDNTWGSIIAGILGGLVGSGAGMLAGPWGALAGGVIGLVAGGLLGNSLLGMLGGIIAFLIIAIALLWALFRVWFALLSAYIMILIDVVFAPFWILAGLVPGSKLSFSSWVRDMAANLAAFPAVYVMFLLGKTFIDAFAQGTLGRFVPPFIGNPGDAKTFGALIGLGIILTTPTAVKMMKTVFGAPQIDLSSVGAAIGVGAGLPSRTVGQSAGMYTAAAFNPYDQTNPRRAALGRMLSRFFR